MLLMIFLGMLFFIKWMVFKKWASCGRNSWGVVNENRGFSSGTTSYFVSLDLALNLSGPPCSSNPRLERLELMISEILSSSEIPNFKALFGQESCMIVSHFCLLHCLFTSWSLSTDEPFSDWRLYVELLMFSPFIKILL